MPGPATPRAILRAVWLLAVCGAPQIAVAKNMNGGEYRIANGIGATPYDTHYHAEHFDVYSPLLQTQYGQVIWQTFDDIAIPEHIVQRFADRTMAIVGYEVDQVRVDEHGQEVPVPITHAYNHHYTAWVKNSRAGKIATHKVDANNPRMAGMTHGKDEYLEYVAWDETNEFTAETIPAQGFSEGNGGEMRLSYHGYPDGYAQLVHAPDMFGIILMQIDTWNREEPSAKFVPGPLPKNSPQRGNPHALYSGLLECPCSDRLTKEWHQAYIIQDSHLAPCDAKGKIVNVTECRQAVQSVVPLAKDYRFRHATDQATLAGCSFQEKHDGTVEYDWNESKDEQQQEELSMDDRSVVGFATGAVNATVVLEKSKDGQATITMVGPADRWFGMGFGALSMCRHMEADECQGGGPYAIIVFDDHIEERHLGLHSAGALLPNTLTVVSNTVVGGNRTVVLTRALEMEDDDYFSFDSNASTMDVILAHGCGMNFQQHCGHGAVSMNFLAVETSMRVCRDGIAGTIDGANFKKTCAPFPTGTLLEQNNPTCSIQAYTGGLLCCRHNKTLLDKDQAIPWEDQLLEYRLKFRFYFEEYKPATAVTPASHQHLVRFYWTTEAFAGEYDVVACPPGTASSQCVQEISSRWKVSDFVNNDPWTHPWGQGPDATKGKGIKLIYAGPHCHAPSCLSMDLYNADTGALICHVEPKPGKSHEVYDEEGFLAIPPCLWSDNSSDGLAAPTFLTMNTTLLSIKRNNNTVSHWGEMASWQMRGIIVMPDETEEELFHKVHSDVMEGKLPEQASATRLSVRRGRHPEA